jgi:hypothetical protein
MTPRTVTLYAGLSLIKNKIFRRYLSQENIEFISHRTQTIDQMNKKELKKLAGCDFCQMLSKYEKERIRAERIKND